ncbi:unnamed protein product [Chrysodeixis includens]|uniref:Uncharacterized protein n=1 Tax=Chrysodeixis includens TaxID=689277 RepID=A0A9N8KWE6_CHRIL|nr:unnamed protein product [Chrysodeixis includens]
MDTAMCRNTSINSFRNIFMFLVGTGVAIVAVCVIVAHAAEAGLQVGQQEGHQQNHHLLEECFIHCQKPMDRKLSLARRVTRVTNDAFLATSDYL